MHPKTVCFTGHRPNKLGGYAPNPVASWVKKRLRNAIERAISKRFVRFISGGALGVDQWAAEIVIELKKDASKSYFRPLELVIARPFPSQDANWPTESKRHFEKILQKADRIVDVCEDPYEVWKMQKRNIWMVDNADVLVAVWDGSSGGPKNTVEYARKVKRPILHIDPKEKTEKWIKP